MKRISSRILIAIVSLTFTTSLIIGGFIYINSIAYIKNETIKKLDYMARSYSHSSSRRLYSVETIINTVESFIVNSFDIDKLNSNPSYIEEYENDIDGFFKETALQNSDFEGIYITFNPELTGEFREIWYFSIEEGSPPQRVNNDLYNKYTDTPTSGEETYPHISLFNRENPAMDYYYNAVEQKTGNWTEPAAEVGFPVTVISYATAIYKEDLLIGVIGIDINIENMRRSIRELEIMKNGHASLLNNNLEVLVHPDFPEYTRLQDVNPELYDLLIDYTGSENTTGETEIFSDEQHFYSCSRLSNGWILMLTIDESEIFKPVNDLAYAILLIALLISSLSFIAAWAFSKRISSPVELATEQLHNLEHGDFSKQFPKLLLEREDEIGTFVKSVDSMSEIIQVEIEKNRQKDAILTYQSRLAKTGEMIAHIAHQWRQPLNNLNLIISNIRESQPYANAEDHETYQSLQKCSRIISDMSQTIDDFRYFLNPKTAKDLFSIPSSVTFLIELMEDSLKLNKIKIETSFDKLPKAYGAANEFTQVISNILYNARDALIESNDENRFISVSIKSKTTTLAAKSAVIEIFNNGPLLEEETIKQLFKPYFTTKSDKKGTGIGLHMSKLIVETHFNGRISLENTTAGVLCKIIIPLTGSKET